MSVTYPRKSAEAIGLTSIHPVSVAVGCLCRTHWARLALCMSDKPANPTNLCGNHKFPCDCQIKGKPGVTFWEVGTRVLKRRGIPSRPRTARKRAARRFERASQLEGPAQLRPEKGPAQARLLVVVGPFSRRFSREGPRLSLSAAILRYLLGACAMESLFRPVSTASYRTQLESGYVRS